MNLYVRQEFGGALRYRVTVPGKGSETFRADEWSRKLSAEIKTKMAHLYNLQRDRIRFVHK